LTPLPSKTQKGGKCCPLNSQISGQFLSNDFDRPQVAHIGGE
jgi:hypothetical protein